MPYPWNDPNRYRLGNSSAVIPPEVWQALNRPVSYYANAGLPNYTEREEEPSLYKQALGAGSTLLGIGLAPFGWAKHYGVDPAMRAVLSSRLVPEQERIRPDQSIEDYYADRWLGTRDREGIFTGAKADPNSVGQEVARRATKFGVQMATDPLSYWMGVPSLIRAKRAEEAAQAGRVLAAAGPEFTAGRAARQLGPEGAGQFQMGERSLAEYAPELSKWAEGTRSRIAAATAPSPYRDAIEKGIHRAFQAQMGLAAASGVGEGIEAYGQGDTAGFAGALTDAALAAGSIAVPEYLQHRQRGALGRAFSAGRAARERSLPHGVESIPSPTDSIPDPFHRRFASNAAANLGMRWVHTDRPSDLTMESFAQTLPEEMQPYAEHIWKEAEINRASINEGKGFIERLRSTFGDRGPTGLSMEGKHGTEDSPSYFLIQRARDPEGVIRVVGGAQVDANALTYVAGGKAMNSPVSAGELYAQLDALGVSREGPTSPLGARARTSGSDRELYQQWLRDRMGKDQPQPESNPLEEVLEPSSERSAQVGPGRKELLQGSGLYSKLQEVVDDELGTFKTPKVLRGREWYEEKLDDEGKPVAVGWLRGKQIKVQEMADMGLDLFLKQRADQPVTREEIQTYLSQQPKVISDVVRGSAFRPPPEYEEAKANLKASEANLAELEQKHQAAEQALHPVWQRLKQAGDAAGYDFRADRTLEEHSQALFELFPELATEYHAAEQAYVQAKDALSEAQLRHQELLEKTQRLPLGEDTQWDQYSLPGYEQGSFSNRFLITPPRHYGVEAKQAAYDAAKLAQFGEQAARADALRKAFARKVDERGYEVYEDRSTRDARALENPEVKFEYEKRQSQKKAELDKLNALLKTVYERHKDELVQQHGLPATFEQIQMGANGRPNYYTTEDPIMRKATPEERDTWSAINRQIQYAHDQASVSPVQVAQQLYNTFGQKLEDDIHAALGPRPERTPNYQPAHFGIPNLHVWVRDNTYFRPTNQGPSVKYNDRRTGEPVIEPYDENKAYPQGAKRGERVLMLQEMQSDLANRYYGNRAEIAKFERALAMGQDARTAYAATPRAALEGLDRHFTDEDLKHRIADAKAENAQLEGIPFLGEHAELMAKYIMGQAVEHGFDRIAWQTGQANINTWPGEPRSIHASRMALTRLPPKITTKVDKQGKETTTETPMVRLRAWSDRQSNPVHDIDVKDSDVWMHTGRKTADELLRRLNELKPSEQDTGPDPTEHAAKLNEFDAKIAAIREERLADTQAREKELKKARAEAEAEYALRNLNPEEKAEYKRLKESDTRSAADEERLASLELLVRATPKKTRRPKSTVNVKLSTVWSDRDTAPAIPAYETKNAAGVEDGLAIVPDADWRSATEAKLSRTKYTVAHLATGKRAVGLYPYEGAKFILDKIRRELPDVDFKRGTWNDGDGLRSVMGGDYDRFADVVRTGRREWEQESSARENADSAREYAVSRDPEVARIEREQYEASYAFDDRITALQTEKRELDTRFQQARREYESRKDLADSAVLDESEAAPFLDEGQARLTIGGKGRRESYDVIQKSKFVGLAKKYGGEYEPVELPGSGRQQHGEVIPAKYVGKQPSSIDELLALHTRMSDADGAKKLVGNLIDKMQAGQNFDMAFLNATSGDALRHKLAEALGGKYQPAGSAKQHSVKTYPEVREKAKKAGGETLYQVGKPGEPGSFQAPLSRDQWRNWLVERFPDNTYIKEDASGDFVISLPGDKTVIFRPEVDHMAISTEDLFAGHGRTDLPALGVTFRPLPYGAIVHLLRGTPEQMQVAAHEYWHVVRHLGNLSYADIAALERAFPEKDGKVSEERQGDAFAEWLSRQSKPKTGRLSRIFHKVYSALKSFGRMLVPEKLTEEQREQREVEGIFRRASESLGKSKEVKLPRSTYDRPSRYTAGRSARHGGLGNRPIADTVGRGVDRPFAATGGPTFQRVDPETFLRGKAGSTRPGYLSHYTPEELAGKQLYTSADGKSGYLLDEHGDLGNVFNNSGRPGEGRSAILHAVANGARTLDAYDGFLPGRYAEYGFVPVGALRWNDEYAPPGWDYEKHGRPDIVFMAYRGGDRATLAERVGSFPAYQHPGKYFDSYAEGQAAARAASLAGGLESGPHGPDGPVPRQYATGRGPQRLAATQNPAAPGQPGQPAPTGMQGPPAPAFSTGRATGNPPRVEERVSAIEDATREQRRLGIPASIPHLDRDTAETWTALDPEIHKILRTWDGSLLDVMQSKERNLTAAESQATDAVIRGKKDLKDNALIDYQASRGTPGEVEAFDRYAKSLADFLVWDRAYVGDGTGLARALAARNRIMRGQVTPDRKFLRQIMKEFPNISDSHADQLVHLWESGDPNFANALRAHIAGNGKKFWTLYRAQLLSIPSEVANITGNTLSGLVEQGDRISASAADWALSKLFRTGKRERYAGEVSAEIGAMTHAIPKILAEYAAERLGGIYKRAWTGEAKKIQPGTPLEHQISPFRSKLLRLLASPLDALGAADDAFQKLNSAGIYAGRAYRMAVERTGMKRGPAVDAEAARLIRDMIDFPEKYPDDINAIRSEAGRRVFRDEAPKLAVSVDQMVRRHPWMTLIAPFIKTPANITRYALRHSPTGIVGAILNKDHELRKAYRSFKEGKISQGQFADTIAPRLTGMMLTTLFAGLAQSGMVTGAGPQDPNQRRAKLASGWQPYSFVWTGSDGNKVYVPYNRFAPVSQIIGTIADIHELKDAKDADDVIFHAYGSIIENLENQSFLRGLVDFGNTLHDPKQYLGNWAANVAQAVTPGTMDKLAAAIDPQYRQTKSDSRGIMGGVERIGRTLVSQTPFASRLLPGRTTPTGQPMLRQGGDSALARVARFVSPTLPTATREGTEVEELMGRVGGVSETKPYIQLEGVKIALSPDQRSVMIAADQKAASELRRLLASPRFASLPDTIEEGGNDSKEAVIRSVFNRHRAEARQRLLRSASFRTAARQQIMESRTKQGVTT